MKLAQVQQLMVYHSAGRKQHLCGWLHRTGCREALKVNDKYGKN